MSSLRQSGVLFLLLVFSLAACSSPKGEKAARTANGSKVAAKRAVAGKADRPQRSFQTDSRSGSSQDARSANAQTEIFASLVQTVKAGQYRALLRFGKGGRVTFRHRTDGKIIQRRYLTAKELDALRPVRDGDRFDFIHYLVWMREELNSDDPGEIEYDSGSPTIKYFGSSSHWGVTFTFTGNSDDLALQTVETWESTP